MKKLLPYLKNEKKLIFFALVGVLLNQVFSLLNPQVFARIIDDYASNIGSFTQVEFTKGVGVLLLIYVAFALVSRTAKAFQDYFVNVISEKVGTRIYGDTIKHVFTLPFHVFEDQQSGSVLQKIQKARDNVKTLIGNVINIGVFSSIGIIFVLTYSLTVHHWIALIFALSIPVVGVIISKLGKSIKGAQEKIVKKSAELAASTTETLQNVGLVKSLGLENQEIKRLNSVNNKILKLEIRKTIILRKLSFVQGTIINAISSSIILVSMILIFGDKVSLGEFLTLWFYGFFVFGPLSQVSTLVSSYQSAKASLGEVDEILKIKPEAALSAETIPLETVRSICLKNVTFHYDSTSRSTVTDISLNIGSGETVALVGPSGAGKSTLLKLILGLYKPKSGSLLYSEVDSSKIDINSLRSKIGYVPQDNQVFAGTIRENLLFVKPNATDEECLLALDQAQATSILDRSQKGLDTTLGENGIKLSGGERQRIAIARALVRKPNVLIFDEATSSLDSLTEEEITKTIKKIRETSPDLIMVLVAHRLSTIAHADTIYALSGGTIIEKGTHKELIDKSGLYASLWNQQV